MSRGNMRGLERRPRMRKCLLLGVVGAVLSASAVAAQAVLPPDINPVTLSRLPAITRADLDAEGQKAFDARATPPMPAPGPGHVTIYSPRTAEGFGLIGRALGV